jgi:hypothetical protein
MISRVKAFGRTRISSRRRRNRSRNHLLRTHEQSRGSARGQHQSGCHGIGRRVVPRYLPLADSMETRLGQQRERGARVVEVVAGPSAALVVDHRRRSATCTQEPIGCGVKLTELWERATGPLVGCAKRYMARLTWRGSRALDGATVAISSEPSDAEVGICA